MSVKKFFALKCSLLALLCGAAVLSLVTQSHAVVLRVENFDSYADGSLLAASAPKWQLQSGAPLQMQVLAGAAVVHEDGSQSEDLRTPFLSGGAGDIYFGLDFSVAALPLDPNGTDSEYFAHFLTNGTFNFNTRFDITAPQSGGDFSVGIASDDSVPDATWATDLSFGVSYRAVARYNQDINQAQLWIDASLPSDTSILGDDKPDPGDTNTAFGLRQSFSSFGEAITVDNIVIGTTFADAIQRVPEPASLVLMLAGLAGMITRRRM